MPDNTTKPDTGGAAGGGPGNRTPATSEILSVSVPELDVEFSSAPAAAAALPPAAPAVTAVTERLEVELEAPAAEPAATGSSARGELVSIYMLAMHLPSADLVAEDYTDSDSGSGVVRRVKEWRGSHRDVAREIENMRRNVYRRIERIWCMVREFGVWVTVSEEGVKEAERLSKEVRERLQRLGLGQFAPRYFVRAVKVYLEPQDARMLLEAAVDQLRGEMEELGRRIDDAVKNQNRRMVKELMYKKEYVKALLYTFKKYIEDISG